jgi:hypothetical protein
MQLPVNPNHLVWQYRLNESVALAVDQGTLQHILAIRTELVEHTAHDSSVLGFAPGATFMPLTDSNGAQVEVDVLSVRDGRLSMFECKSGGELPHESELRRLLLLGQKIGCGRLVVTSTGTTDAVDDIARGLAIAFPAIEIESWSGQQLLDPAPHSQAPKPDPAQYLRDVITGLEMKWPD